MYLLNIQIKIYGCLDCFEVYDPLQCSLIDVQVMHRTVSCPCPRTYHWHWHYHPHCHPHCHFHCHPSATATATQNATSTATANATLTLTPYYPKKLLLNSPYRVFTAIFNSIVNNDLFEMISRLGHDRAEPGGNDERDEKYRQRILRNFGAKYRRKNRPPGDNILNLYTAVSYAFS